MLLAQPSVKLLASEEVPGARFGNAVSVTGNALIVGANLHDGVAADAGAAYIYQKQGESWQESAVLFAEDAEAGDGFGVSVAIDGGFAIVGALGDDEAGNNAGAAYVYQQQGATWVPHTKLVASDGKANDGFGFSVDIHGSLAIVGARGVDENGNSSGAAYIFLYANDDWVQLDKLTPRDGSSGDLFGSSVAISDFFAVVGAVLADGAVSGTGVAYVFQNRGAIWLQYARLFAENGNWLDQFGTSVAMFGNTVVVGARAADNVAVDAGAAHVFEIGEEGVVETAYLVAGDGAGEDLLGYSVTAEGNYVVLGAPGDDDLGVGAGAAYVFEKNNGVWQQIEKLRPQGVPGDQAGARFGVSAGAFGGIAVVGAPANEGDEAAGAAYVFDLSLVRTEITSGARPASRTFDLREIYPNPATTRSYLSFELHQAATVVVEILDVRGRRIQVLVDEARPPGRYSEVWDGTDERGVSQPAGVYLVRVQAGRQRENVLVVRI